MIIFVFKDEVYDNSKRQKMYIHFNQFSYNS